jgi:hypothetical protein
VRRKEHLRCHLLSYHNNPQTRQTN